MADLAVIVLAAGKGTRMFSDLPKVLHQAAGRSLLGHVLTTVVDLAPARLVVVAGPDMPEVAEEARRYCSTAATVVQAERNGTAHAVSMAEPHLADFKGKILIVYGDVPLLGAATLRALADAVGDAQPLAVLGFEATDPTGYGRLIVTGDGRFTAIREELDATPEERAVTLCNSGVMAVDSALLWELLPGIGSNNAKGEFYLTDLPGLVVAAGRELAFRECPEDEVLGVNNRAQLAVIEAALQHRLRRAAMLKGATLVAPETVFLSVDTELGQDVVVEPHVVFASGVKVGNRARIRSFCHIERATIGEAAIVGPFARLRPGATLARDVHVGNFVEIKQAVIDDGAKINHLAYVGDAHVGAAANVGAGAITCNYNGVDKNLTEIGARAFIGTNASLVAPVRVGEGAFVAAGSVVTSDVDPDALYIERGESKIRANWVKRYFEALRARKAGAAAPREK
ncbi:MAG TPA: bifunctional UDP-N-acetylglucosamine diphosphorylase/glucosamine-1-phosphate N-acetyltransferase GlmU [Aestuariivirgaceae bacterium]|jgi:bifunctional UDP-N-acetylglucosamine pyrophosphorylase/glucosamine-1-phosphate N-acetyltransferase|nr:bifunctional UDP-N-acetylglucosamine diphosphorylase/glucosamine-1-phosphate N-acetyltransferase GlmU [Aestuariivirgaceae bacterium]